MIVFKTLWLFAPAKSFVYTHFKEFISSCKGESKVNCSKLSRSFPTDNDNWQFDWQLTIDFQWQFSVFVSCPSHPHMKEIIHLLRTPQYFCVRSKLIFQNCIWWSYCSLIMTLRFFCEINVEAGARVWICWIKFLDTSLRCGSKESLLSTLFPSNSCVIYCIRFIHE